MDVATIAQVVTAITNTLFVIVLAVGYYITWRVSQQTLNEMKAQRMAVGRPQVIVDDDYESLPEVNTAVRNVSQGAARDITFEFSAPVESSNGFVISDLPYFAGGMDFLPPDGEISTYWDHLEALLPFLEQKGLGKGIRVTTRYKGLDGQSYETSWLLNPFIYRDGRFTRHKGMSDLVTAVEKLAAEKRDTPDSKPGAGG
jgi:hypothetical protein